MTGDAADVQLGVDEFRDLFGPWRPWRPREVLERFGTAPFRWWVAGGWAAEAGGAAPRPGVSYLRPELVLLFKAKLRRPKDEEDLRSLVPRLDEGARRWLQDALALAHPGHAWSAVLGS